MTSELSPVDEEIYSCLNLDDPNSFFLFAGAGSGKTRSLVTVLQKFRNDNIQRLRLSGQKVAIITYTNAACDEIKSRLEFDATFEVSTIHSFSWELIRPFQADIKEWVRANTQTELDVLLEKHKNGRAGTKAAIDRERQIAAKEKRVSNLDSINTFVYNPNGTNSGRDSLNHAEVIKIASEFLDCQPLMQKILIRTYPILLIDESQDTKKELIEAFFKIQSIHSDEFSLGLFGDTMQRIYMDGKLDLGHSLPESWSKPVQNINYRCPKRVITLINKIREDQPQEPADINEDGIVRLFIVDSSSDIDKKETELKIANQMAGFTSDELWKSLDKEVKILTLEHLMAARRGGFLDFFLPLYNMNKDSTGLLDGSMSGIPLFTKQLIPLIKAMMSGNEFEVADLIKKYSPLLDRNILRESNNSVEQIQQAKEAIGNLFSMWSGEEIPPLINVIQKAYQLNLLTIPDVLLPIAQRTEEDSVTDETEEKEYRDDVIDAWDAALQCSFSQVIAYADYVSDKSRFGTHQGVKGLEFPRVMVILDDEEARGFLFSYEKLLGAKDLTDTDRNNIAEGKETSIDRTRRLFYVICSRAEKSLAIVTYTKSAEKIKEYAISQGWFAKEEIVRIS